MALNIKYYGNITEITTIEKRPRGARISRSREKHALYRPRRPDSLSRSKSILVRRVLSALKEFGAPLLATFTFKGTAADVAFATHSLSQFQRKMRLRYPDSHSVFVPEFSPSGRLHFHGLLFGLPMHWGNISKRGRIVHHGTEFYDRTLAKLWGQGFVDLQQTNGADRLASYVGKYVTKDGGHVMFAPVRIVRVSHGFPKEIKYSIDDEYLEKKILATFSKKVPLHHWESVTPFLGKITKTKYSTNEKNQVQ